MKKKGKRHPVLFFFSVIRDFLPVSCSTLTFEETQIYISSLQSSHTHTVTDILWLVGIVGDGRVQPTLTGRSRRPGSADQDERRTNPISELDSLRSRKAKFSWTENKPREMRLLSDYRETSWTSSLMRSYDRSETDEAQPAPRVLCLDKL